MLETSARLLRLLSLFQARRYWSGAELSERLEVTGRTLRRDVDRLRKLGYPVHSTSGTAGGYQLGAGAMLPPLLLDDDEAVAVALGLRTASSGSVTGIEEASLRALTKLEQVLPSRLRHRVTALHSFIVPLARPRPNVDAATLSVIANACRDHQRLGFAYQDRNGAPSKRNTEPHWLVHTGYRWYLVAWDERRKDWRSFRVDRMEKPVVTGLRFTPRTPPSNDVAAYVARGISYEQYPYRAEVILHAPIETLAKWVPLQAGVLKPIDAQTCVLQTGSYSFEMLARHLVLFGVDFEVKDQPELVEEIRRLAERCHRATPSAIGASATS